MAVMDDDWDSPEGRLRRSGLRGKYGQAKTFRPVADALRLAGHPEVDPDGAHAFLYPTREAAEAYAAANAEHGIPSLGIAETAAGWVGVLDLRPALAAAKRRATESHEV